MNKMVLRFIERKKCGVCYGALVLVKCFGKK